MTVGRPNFTIPILAVAAFAATLGWFVYRHYGPSGFSLRTGPANATRGSSEPAVEAPSVPAPAQSSGQPPSLSAPDVAVAEAPAFDVVRVSPSGEVVLAGRAAPGATVELLVDGRRHASVVADSAGLFALVPEPLAPGSHELVLQAGGREGEALRSPRSITVVVAANRQDAPLVTVTAPGQPAVVLSRPAEPTRVAAAGPDGRREDGVPVAAPVQARPGQGGAARPQPAASVRQSVRVESVETEGAGRLLVSGRAAPNATVRLYLNDTFVAPGLADGEGRVSFSIEKGMRPGLYRVRLDEVDAASAQVRSRAEVPFDMPRPVAAAETAPPSRVASAEPVALGPVSSEAPPSEAATAAAPSVASASVAPPTAPDTAPPRTSTATVVVPEINTATVSRGDSLWAISKRTYGQGWRFSVIYGANTGQIRDPNLIYPGQLFVLPTHVQPR